MLVLERVSGMVAGIGRRRWCRSVEAVNEAKRLFSDLDEAKKYHRVDLDTHCDGKADVGLRYPVDTSKPLVVVIDIADGTWT